MDRLTYKNLERTSLIILAVALVLFSLYYFVFKINWIDFYKTQNESQNIALMNESCLKCHGIVTGFSSFHDPQQIGCASCHLGNVKGKNKNTSHQGLIIIPGNSDDAKSTCGKTDCHPGIAERVDSSLMSTMSGIISVNKFAFEEIANPSGKFHIEKIRNSPAESHLRNLCASCHLGNKKNEFGPITELTRGGGCNACHLNYSEEALSDLKKYNLLKIEKPDSALLKFHPSLSLNIKNEHCFGCHSRSGRISTSYEGWHETSLAAENITDFKKYRLLQDGRVFKMIKPDIHFEAGLVCVDCHISYEIMSDGNFYEHKEEQIIVQCEDCHSYKKRKEITLKEFDYESMKIAQIKKIYHENRKFIRIKKSKTPLINSYFENGRKPKLIGKQSEKIYDLNSPKFECESSLVHTSLSCNSCHTAWTPQCVGCHTQFQVGTEGFDLLENESTDSSWVEFHGDFFAELPTLGIKEKIINDVKIYIVDTFIPGMIMTIDKSNFKEAIPELIFKRLFAPTVAHTIRKESRTCKSCHNDPLALGFGRGKLEYIIHNNIGRWVFEPKYKTSEFDNLPEDAWIGFLKLPGQDHSTRENVRPFNIEEQKKILKVGSCLVCHESDSDIVKSSLINYNDQLKKLSPECILPTWD